MPEAVLLSKSKAGRRQPFCIHVKEKEDWHNPSSSFINMDEGVRTVKNEAVFLECIGEIAVSDTSEFFRLYQQSILLALQEQGVINETQLQYCLDTLNHHFET